MADLVLYDAVLDDGLQALTDDADVFYLCNDEPTTYYEASTTFAVGTGSIAFGAISSASPDGRTVASSGTIGTASATDTATHWAVVNSGATALLAAGVLAAPIALTDNEVFTLGIISITLTGIALVLAPPTASGLLAGNTDGFAIEATVSGGTVCVLDTGTPANDLSDVGLDVSNLVQNSTSPKLVQWNSAPYVRWTPHNKLVSSQEFDNWNLPAGASVTPNDTTAPDSTSTADLITQSAGTAQMNQYYIYANAFAYTQSIYLKYVDTQWVIIDMSTNAEASDVLAWFDIQNGVVGTLSSSGYAGTTAISSSVTDAGDGWWRVSVSGRTMTGTVQYMYVWATTGDGVGTVANPGNFYAWGAQSVRGVNTIPYLPTTTAARVGIPQAYDVAEGKFGILSEDSITNLVVTSDRLGHPETAPDTVAPDGTYTARTEGNYSWSGVTITANANFTMSGYFKYIDTQWILFNPWDGTCELRQWFDIQNGALGSHAVLDTGAWISASIVEVGDGWYRCSVTGSLGSGKTTCRWQVQSAAADGSITFSGGTWVGWGAQFEEDVYYASSYTPTWASPVVRASDAISLGTSSFPWDATQGSVYVCAKSLFKPATVRGLFALSGNDMPLYTDIDGGNYHPKIYDGTNGANTSAEVMVVGTSFVTGASWGALGLRVTIDGNAVHTVTFAGSMGSETTAYVGNYDGNHPFVGFIYQLAYVPSQIDDATLPTWNS